MFKVLVVYLSIVAPQVLYNVVDLGNVIEAPVTNNSCYILDRSNNLCFYKAESNIYNGQRYLSIVQIDKEDCLKLIAKSKRILAEKN